MNEKLNMNEIPVAYEGTYLPRAPRTFHKGMYCLVAFFGVLLLLAFSLPYPVTISAPMTLQTFHPVVHLQAPGSAPVAHLFVALGDTVKKGQQLAVLESNTTYGGIQRLKKLLAPSYTDSVQLENLTGLGPDLQTQYAWFVSALGRWVEFNEQDMRSLQEREQSLQWRQSGFDIAQQRSHLENANRNLEFHKKDVERYRKLHHKGVISTQELEYRERSYLDARARALEARKELERGMVNRERLSNARTMGNNSMDREERRLFEEWKLSREALQGALKKWEELHLLTSPIDGIVSFASVHSRNQWASRNKRMFSITPIRASEWFAECRVPLHRIGELHGDQRVRIHLDAYPFQQWGALEATVDTRAEIPYEGHYYMRALLDGDTTGQGRKVALAHDMRGMAYIEVSRSSLIGRIWGTVGNAAKGHWNQGPIKDTYEQ